MADVDWFDEDANLEDEKVKSVTNSLLYIHEMMENTRGSTQPKQETGGHSGPKSMIDVATNVERRSMRRTSAKSSKKKKERPRKKAKSKEEAMPQQFDDDGSVIEPELFFEK